MFLKKQFNLLVDMNRIFAVMTTGNIFSVISRSCHKIGFQTYFAEKKICTLHKYVHIFIYITSIFFLNFTNRDQKNI